MLICIHNMTYFLSIHLLLNWFHNGQSASNNKMVTDGCGYRLDVTAKPATREYCFSLGMSYLRESEP